MINITDIIIVTSPEAKTYRAANINKLIITATYTTIYSDKFPPIKIHNHDIVRVENISQIDYNTHTTVYIISREKFKNQV